MALALKYGGGYDAFKEEPRLRKYAQFMMDMLTPPDPRPRQNDPAQKNLVSYWVVGDTSRQEATGMLNALSLGFAGVDDKLAGALLTMSARMGNPPGV